MKAVLSSITSGAPEAARYTPPPEGLPHTEVAAGRYHVRFARSAAEVDAALRLRFEVFNLELNEGLESSFRTGRDRDEFDPTCHHLVVNDGASGETVGTYRLRTGEMALAAGGFYSAGEFNLSRLPPEVLASSVEIGRACIAREHRNTRVLFLLWKGLAAYMEHSRKRYFFGCCSLTSQDPREGMRVLNQLQRERRLHPTFHVPPRPGLECSPEGYFVVDGQEASVPSLFRTYLRFGAKVCGPPAIDRLFKTIDFFVIFDRQEMGERTRQIFFGQ